MRAILDARPEDLRAIIEPLGPRGAAFPSSAWHFDRPLLFYALAQLDFSAANYLMEHGASLSERSTLGLSPSICCFVVSEAPDSEAQAQALFTWLRSWDLPLHQPVISGASIPSLPKARDSDGPRQRGLPAEAFLAHFAAQACQPSLLSQVFPLGSSEPPSPVLDSAGGTPWHWLAEACRKQASGERIIHDFSHKAGACADILRDHSIDPRALDLTGCAPEDFLCPGSELALFEALALRHAVGPAPLSTRPKSL